MRRYPFTENFFHQQTPNTNYSIFLIYISSMFTIIILCIILTVINAQHGVNWNYPCTISSNQNYKFCDYSLSFEERANDLVYNVEAGLSDNLTVWQSLFNVQAASIGELNIPQYQWGNEALHGIANSFGVNWNGKITSATMFPMPIATSSSFNNKLFYQIGQVISTEARAMFNSNQCGLSFWAPNSLPCFIKTSSIWISITFFVENIHSQYLQGSKMGKRARKYVIISCVIYFDVIGFCI